MSAGSVVAYIPDLLDRSRVSAAASAASRPFVVARTPGDLATLASIDSTVVVDLGRAGVLEALAGLGDVRTIGFASHVDTEVIKAARAAGCGRVLARSAFFSGISRWITVESDSEGKSGSDGESDSDGDESAGS